MTMVARSPHEPHRVATPLELFFDLVFVVAIAQAAAGLHHAVAERHVAAGLMGYAMAFFAIWWAWMNFTWFASAYDCDDVPYRLLVLVQLTGALILAAGIGALLEERHLNVATIGGYVVMRLALVAQWLRAAGVDSEHRVTAIRYAVGVGVLQVAWIALYFVPGAALLGFVTLALAELAIPVWAERESQTPWHPHHIAERYGLLTIIVLGESILSAMVAVRSALSLGESIGTLAPMIVGGLLLVFSMWWIYFDRPVHDLLGGSLSKAIFWGYGHYFVFASAAAVGAGLAVSVDAATGHAAIGRTGAGFAVAIPIVIFLGCLWILHDRPEYRRTRWMAPAFAPIILLAPLTAHPLLAIGCLVAAMVAIKGVLRMRNKKLTRHLAASH